MVKGTGTYYADQLIGVNLYAAKRLPLYKLPDTTSAIIGYAEKGQKVGTVYSYVGGNSGNPLFWQFIPINGIPYYVPHKTGDFDFAATEKELIIKGEKTVAQQVKDAIEAQKKEEMGAFAYYLQKFGKPVLITIAAVALGKELIKKQ